MFRWYGVFIIVTLALAMTTCSMNTSYSPTIPSTIPPEPLPEGAAQFRTDFSRRTVPYNEIRSGGPPKDGIPAIDEPRFVSVATANEWLRLREPVIALILGDEARAYPIQILIWHEIVNDTVGDIPVIVTFCPLCNTAIAFERRIDDQSLDFGTTGLLRYSNLIMYDRQTESWWQQATGEAIAGTFAGRRLLFVPVTIVAWETFATYYPDGMVLSRETGYSRDYGRNPYPGYDDVDHSPFLYDGPSTPSTLPALARVLTVEHNGDAVAYPYDTLASVGLIHDQVGGMPVVVIWRSGAASPLDSTQIADGRDVGMAVAYRRELDGRPLQFVMVGDHLIDRETGSRWDFFGRAFAGSLTGAALTPVPAINHFWFSWAAFRPDTRIYR
ncbi:MAG: DUF3179 domain-containing protein [Chloroflexus sp.]|jgi:hypothetical protein|nr:DUF3179 domain-containing protein [Chloroflexus sp.]MBO9349347.1 DUF3179 domain-containing protein [Chloroflexus sp.]